MATTFALIALAAAWWTESAHRQGRARQSVESALEQVAAWRQEGRWAEAKAVLAQADSRLYDAGLLRLRTQFKRSLYDLDLAARVEDIRLRRTGLLEDPSHHRSTAREYAAVFQEARSKFPDDQTVAERIRRSPIRETLLAGLDDWALVEEDAIMRSRLLQIARWADPDPSWRDRVRDPAVRHDRKVLEQLAADAPETDCAAAVVDDPGRLAQAGRRRRRAAAPRGATTSPDRLLAQLRARSDAHRGQALGCHRLLPGSPGPAAGDRLDLLQPGPGPGGAGDRQGARESYRRAIAIDPNLAAVRTRLGDLLAQGGQEPFRGPSRPADGASRE